MAFSSGRKTISLDDILKQISEVDILSHYLGITSIPCVINSPLREDQKPSLGLYSKDGIKIKYIDFATGDTGGTFNLLSLMWNISFNDVLEKINNELLTFKKKELMISKCEKLTKPNIAVKANREHLQIKVKIRDWKQYDIEYWKSFGISLDWLKYANVYPISHKFIIKDNKKYTFGTDKYAYAYIEKKEGKVSIKIYQPFNKKGFKWCTSTDSSVVSLWTKVPDKGEKICICSSLKDALCLWANTGIPAIAPQGEGYNFSPTAVDNLKSRFKNIYILYDNDKAGIEDSTKISQQNGFKLLILPNYGAKDISDLYKLLNNKEKFKEILLSLFN